jgi:hypothetical protein
VSFRGRSKTLVFSHFFSDIPSYTISPFLSLSFYFKGEIWMVFSGLEGSSQGRVESGIEVKSFFLNSPLPKIQGKVYVTNHN